MNPLAIVRAPTSLPPPTHRSPGALSPRILSPTPAPRHLQASVFANTLNCRLFPSTAAKNICGYVHSGDVLDILWSADRWLCVLDDDIHAKRGGNGLRFWVSKWWTCPYYRPFKGRFWPTDYATITQRFGARPEYYKKFGLPGHEGMDVRAPEGTPVYAVDTGRVFVVYRNPLSKAKGGHNYGYSHQGGS